jgi:hypothetical protein
MRYSHSTMSFYPRPISTDNILHASNGATYANCSSTPQGMTITTGNWQESFIQGSYQYALTSTFPTSQLATANVSIQFEPYVASLGIYQVYVTTPGCVGASACGQRTQVDLTMTLSPGNTSVVTLDQANTADTRQMIYSGMVSPSIGSFKPTILLTVAKNATAPSSGTVSIVADSIELVRNNTGATLVSVLEFSMQNYTSNTTSYKPLTSMKCFPLSSAAFALDINTSLPDQLPVGSIVNVIDASQGDLYIGGAFTTTQGSHSIAKYQYSTAQYTPLGAAQFNGSISSLLLSGSSLFAGGNFTSTANGTTPAISYFGKYDTQSNSWTPSPPVSIHVSL